MKAHIVGAQEKLPYADMLPSCASATLTDACTPTQNEDTRRTRMFPLFNRWPLMRLPALQILDEPAKEQETYPLMIDRALATFIAGRCRGTDEAVYATHMLPARAATEVARATTPLCKVKLIGRVVRRHRREFMQ
jgi:hypothetical protein